MVRKRDPNNPFSPVGEFMAERMKVLGIRSRAELARRCDLSNSTLAKIFDHDRSMRPRTAEILAHALKCSSADILERTRPPESPPPRKPPGSAPISHQLCWTCVNAVPDGKHGCCWSRELEPVPGWTAEKDNKGGNKTYRITKCPDYVPDPPKEVKDPRTLTGLPSTRSAPATETVFDRWCREKGAW